MHLSLRFLGSFEAQINSGPTIESRAKRIEALLAFLAIESDHAHRRDRLVGLLFPETLDDQARANLRQTLTRLRRAIKDQEADPPYLLISRESTQFNRASDHSLDVIEFENLLGGCLSHQPEPDLLCQDCMQCLSEAIDLYRGPFLEGFSLDDSAAYEDWILSKREQYRVDALTALQHLADHYERRGTYALATGFVRRQLRLEPWKEEAHRQLMRLLAYQGQRTTALQQYQTLEALLWDELGVEPLAETRSLYESIRTAEDNRPHRLPPRSTTFVGRNTELALLNEYLTDPGIRLITLTGPGGSGKTAIAVETGWRVASRFLGPFYHGVFFVPLAGIDHQKTNSSPGSVEFDPFVTAIAEGIGFSFSGPRRPHEQLSRYLRDKSLLLIIDNVEHVINEARPLLADLLQQAPDINLLITSRERLGRSEEWVLEIEGLPYPGNGSIVADIDRTRFDPSVPQAQYHSIALFENLGKRLVPDFVLGDESLPNASTCPFAVANRIVQLVQGLPLGIELAASWLRMLSCTEIAAEIESSLDFLSSTMYDLPSRHRSLRAVFDSSWQLLDEKERQALRRLSVFYGPFDRAAATAVTGASLVTLSALVDHSMLHRQDIRLADQTVGHFELLEVLRQYAMEQLEKSPDSTEEIQAQHSAFYLDLLCREGEKLRGSEQRKAVTAISQNIKEIRAAWHWAIRQKDISGLSGALEPLGLFYYMRSWFAEGADLFGLATSELDQNRGEPSVDVAWAQLRARQGWFTFLLGNQQEGKTQLLESIDVLRACGEAVDLAYSLSFTAAVLSVLGDYEQARRMAEEALTINEKYQNTYGCAISNNILSQIAYQQGAYPTAKQHSEASLALERVIDNRWSIGFSLTNLGRVAFALEDYDEAYNFFSESLEIRRELGDSRGQALSLRYLGETAQAQDNLDQAQSDLECSLTLFRSIGSQDETSATLNCMGRVALQRQDNAAAQRYFMEALQIARQAGTVPRMLEAITGLACLAAPEDPMQIAQVAAAIQNHPAANRISREQTGELLQNLQEHFAIDTEDIDLSQDDIHDLDALSESLLAYFT